MSKLAAALCRRIGFVAAANWLAGRRILFPSAVARRVELLIATELLDLPLRPGTETCDAAEMAHAVSAVPLFRDGLHKPGPPAEAQVIGQKIANALGDYAGTRSAVSEMTTALVTLAVGALVFRAMTPGLISMAPGIADMVARSTAIANFPLGQFLGGLWFELFPTAASPWLLAGIVAVLGVTGSVFTAFAGALADPVQSRLGIHRRRLLRLIDTLEAELFGSGDKPFAAREHYYARLMDLWDVGASAFRIFRN